jgi:hypothetical protein
VVVVQADDRASFEVKKAQLVAKRAGKASKKALKPKRMRACAEDDDDEGEDDDDGVEAA